MGMAGLVAGINRFSHLHLLHGDFGLGPRLHMVFLRNAVGGSTEKFFFDQYLGVTDSFWNFGGLQMNVVIPLLLVWIFVYFVMRQQAHKGIERLSRTSCRF